MSFSLILDEIRYFTNCDVIPLIIIVDVSLHFEKVDNSLEFIFLTDWNL